MQVHVPKSHCFTRWSPPPLMNLSFTKQIEKTGPLWAAIAPSLLPDCTFQNVIKPPAVPLANRFPQHFTVKTALSWFSKVCMFVKEVRFHSFTERSIEPVTRWSLAALIDKIDKVSIGPVCPTV